MAPFSSWEKEALEQIEACDNECSLVKGQSRSEIRSLSHGQFNVCSTLLHIPVWPDDFSLFPEFPCHDSSDSKGLNYGQNIDVIRSRLWFEPVQPQLWPEARVVLPLSWASWSGMTNLANFPTFLINLTFSLFWIWLKFSKIDWKLELMITYGG